ncbi:MAG: DUF58 domain-containing protein [Thermoleophilia bacterium]
MPTRKTILWLLTASILYLIAWNIGGGWLYAIIAIVLAFPLGSLLLSRINTRGIAIEQQCQDRCARGDILRTRVTIANGSRLPRFLLKLSGELAGGESSLLLVNAPGGGSTEAVMTFGPVSRGIFSGGSFLLSSQAPAGLARSRRRLRTSCPVVVYPRWYPLPGDWGSERRSTGFAVTDTTPARVPCSDYLGVREYRPQDTPRSIHWRTTARSNSLAVTEYARQRTVSPVIIIDPWRQADIGPAGDSSLEVAATLAATLVQRETAHKRRFGIGTSLADAAQRGFDSDPEVAMLMLAGLRPDGDQPLDLDTTGPGWTDITPVVVTTSLSRYAGIGRGALFERHPGAILLMVDGRACNPTAAEARSLMDDSQLAGVARELDDAGCRFVLVDPSEDEGSWLTDL